MLNKHKYQVMGGYFIPNETELMKQKIKEIEQDKRTIKEKYWSKR